MINKPDPKLPYDLDVMFERISRAVEPYPPAAMFQLYNEGYATPFEQLVACIISIRTYDEMTVPIARRLFTRARTAAEMLKLTPVEIDELIRQSTFHENKAYQIHAMAEQLVETYGGELPCDGEIMRSFSGVGIKCSNLVLGIACHQAQISVDIHVHRVTNRWGYVKTTAPEKTTQALEKVLPEKFWVEINRLLVPFGKHICTGQLPHCSTCPVLEYCQQVGVVKHR